MIGWWVLRSGFSAISDDDFARVVIAQQFAHAPSWDPSGTSWLPLPFWLYGGVMMLFGRELEVARATAFGIGILSCACVLLAGRALGLSRGQAFFSAFVSALLPDAARLSVATVPESLSAGLLVLGASLGWRSAARLYLGAACLALSCLCRYEAWPVACVFAVVCAHGALRRRSLRATGAAAAAVFPIGAWMLHGIVNHGGDALFFVKRVEAYRAALSGAHESTTVAQLLAPPWEAFRYEPELSATLILGFAIVVLQGRTSALRNFRGLFVLLGSLLSFLMLGEWLKTTATHHSERLLLPVWLAGTLLLSKLGALVLASEPRVRWPALCAAGLFIPLSLGLLRPKLASGETFAVRADEVQIGKAAALEQPAGTGVRVAVDTPDYGFFAVIAGFGRPEASVVLDDHDPRSASTPATFLERLKRARAELLVTTEARQRAHPLLGTVLGRAGGLVLLRLARR